MQCANANDRATIERIYPPAVFAREAQANTRAKASVLYGVRIQSAPDTTGDFQLVRASHHVGEDESAANSLFLCPFAQATERGGAAGDYDAFIDRIIAAARTARFDRSPGRDDARLQGLRQ